jgi:hypothetical protein
MSIQRRRSANCKCCKCFAISLLALLIRASSSFVSNHCVEVFQYAARHGYRKLMDEAGLIAVQNKYWSSQLSTGLYQQDIQAAWV